MDGSGRMGQVIKSFMTNVPFKEKHGNIQRPWDLIWVYCNGI